MEHKTNLYYDLEKNDQIMFNKQYTVNIFYKTDILANTTIQR